MRRRARLLYFIVSGIIIIFLSTGVKGSYRSDQSGEEGVAPDGRFFHPGGPVLSMDIQDEPLKDVLERISDQNGITFSLPPSLGEEKVMIRFSNLTLEECLVKLLAPYNHIFIYREDRAAAQLPVRRLTEVRIFPHQYEGRVKEPVMKIAEGDAEIKGEVIAKDSRKDRRKSADVPEIRETTYIEDLTLTLKGRDPEAKLDAVEVLRDAGPVAAIGALSIAIKDSDPRVKNEAVAALLKVGKELKDESELEETEVPKSSGTGKKKETLSDEPEPEPDPQPVSRPSLRVMSTSGDSANLYLDNAVEVGGLQFTVAGTKITEVRTTPRTEGFVATFSENGRVLLMNPSKGTIAPGTGPIVEVIGTNGGFVRVTEKTINDKYGNTIK